MNGITILSNIMLKTLVQIVKKTGISASIGVVSSILLLAGNGYKIENNTDIILGAGLLTGISTLFSELLIEKEEDSIEKSLEAIISHTPSSQPLWQNSVEALQNLKASKNT